MEDQNEVETGMEYGDSRKKSRETKAKMVGIVIMKKAMEQAGVKRCSETMIYSSFHSAADDF